MSCIRFQYSMLIPILNAYSNMLTMITKLQDTHLLAQIDREESEDLIAKEVKYHLKCLTALRNHYISDVRKLNQGGETCASMKRR